MSCCGEKRKNLFRNENSSRENIKNEQVLADNPKSDKIFMFTGSDSLVIKGVSGQTYQFRFKGDKLNVSAIDQLGFMAERDLKVYHQL
jgi:hypothetical protein